MATVTIRFTTAEDVARWEALEKRGKIGPRQQKRLNEWRTTGGKPAANVLGEMLIEQLRQEAMEEVRRDALEDTY